LKLIYCPECHDVRTVIAGDVNDDTTLCKCRKSFAKCSLNSREYVVYGGKAIPLTLNGLGLKILSKKTKADYTSSCGTIKIHKVSDTYFGFIPFKKAPKIRCRKCRDVVYSIYRHDFSTCKCGAVSLDGGFDYCRIVGEPENVLEVKRPPNYSNNKHELKGKKNES
jgi:hypothetical protein